MSRAADTLEREQELDHIAAALESAAVGAGRAVIVEGPAGIGKTRLVHDARALAKVRGFARIQATGDELESAMAWSVVRQLVERSISRYQGRDREALLAGPSGAALRTLDDAPGEAPVGDAAVARTLHALWWVAVDLSSFRPLLITVDDAQWADLPSLRFLEYLSRRIADLPIALVVATRPPQEHSGPLLALSSGRAADRLLPAPLSQAGVAALGAHRCERTAEPVVAAVHAASGGNPFLAGLLLDELTTQGLSLDDPATAGRVAAMGPSAVSRALLARLPSDAIALAGGAAVLGARSELTLAAALTGLDDARPAAAVDALVTGNVLTARGEQLAFVHPVVREAVLAQLAPGERAALHAKAARELHALAAPVPRVAAHLVFAPTGTLPTAAALLREAAAGLLADGDAPTAAAHLTRALDETPADRELQTALGLALLRAGEPADAREHLRAAARAAQTPRDRAERLASAASATSLVDGPSAATAELRAILDTWPEPADDPDRLVLEARLAAISSLLPEEGLHSTQRLLAFAELPGRTPEERLILSMLAQRGRYDVRPAHEVVALATRALGDGAYLSDAADGADGMIGWLVAVLALASADGTALAAAEIERARTRVRAQGSPLEYGLMSVAAAWLAWRTGDVAAAETETDAAMSAVSAEPDGPHVHSARATATHCRILAALERGDRAGAADALKAFDAASAASPRVISVASLREARSLLALAGDQPAVAQQEALTLGDELRVAHLDTPTLAWRSAAALASLRLGEERQARALATEHLELAQRWGTATDSGAALRIMARVEPERRVELLTEAVAVLEASPARLELGRALVDLGEALRVVRRRKDAHEPLRRGADLAVDCGSRVLRQRALEGLAALGDQPRKLMFSGEESLTASERRVARLAVDGRSNRGIAQELFVSPKTVENHLGRVYVKLGISSRWQLAGYLG